MAIAIIDFVFVFRPYVPFSLSRHGFVNFDISPDHVTARGYHSTSQLVEPGLSSLITAQSKNSLETQSTDAEFLIGYMPHGLKPDS